MSETTGGEPVPRPASNPALRRRTAGRGGLAHRTPGPIHSERSNPPPAPGKILSVEREYDTQLLHTIWELERAVKAGSTNEPMRRSLVEAHGQYLRHLEEIAQIPRQQRSQLLLQGRPTETILMLPGEGATAEDLIPLAELLHRRGFAVLATNLATRTLDRPGHSPSFWQTVADEAETRYDAIVHYATRVSILGVGLSAVLGLHVATTRRVEQVAAIFPTFGSEPNWLDRARATLRRLVLRDTTMPRGWNHQRQLAAAAARVATAKSAVPLFVLVANSADRGEAGRSARAAQKLANRTATIVRALRPDEPASLRDLPPAVTDELVAFLRRR